MPLANFIHHRPATVFSGIVMTTVLSVGLFFEHLDSATPERRAQRQLATTTPQQSAVEDARIVQTRLMGAGQETPVMKTSERKPL